MTGSGQLIVGFCGEEYKVEAHERLTFGRDADLCIDENPYLHRVLGVFEARHGRWWLSNSGSAIALDLFDRTTRSTATVMPATDQALPGNDVVIRFSAGATVYELEAKCPDWEPSKREPIHVPVGDTLQATDLPMTESQLQLILVLAENKLLEPHAPTIIPPTKEAATRLGWPTTKFNRKLDNVCEKLTRVGVSGLKASSGDVATDRRRRLVEYSVSVGLVDVSMLPLLDRESP